MLFKLEFHYFYAQFLFFSISLSLPLSLLFYYLYLFVFVLGSLRLTWSLHKKKLITEKLKIQVSILQHFNSFRLENGTNCRVKKFLLKETH